MIAEKELIAAIKELRQIKPEQNWVFLTKNRIFDQHPIQHPMLTIKHRVLDVFDVLTGLLFQPKVALAGVSTLAILFGVLILSQDSLPGDYLYTLKRATEKSRAIFISQNNIAKNNLETANKRLEELTKIAQTNQVKKIAPALEEYQASLAEAAKNLVKAAATTSDPAIIKNIVLETQKLEENRTKLEKLYGIAGLEAKEGENPTQLVAEWLLNDLGKRTLTDEQKLLFEEAKNDYENGDYNLALEKILKLSEFNY